MRMPAKVLLMRGNRMDGDMNDRMEMNGDMRRYPRYDDGRFAPRSEMNVNYRYEMNRGARSEPNRTEMYDRPDMRERREMYAPRNEYRNDYRSEYRMNRPDEMMQREYPMERPYNHKEEIGFRSGKKEHGHASSSMGMDETTAMEWVEGMRNEDGSKGEHFPFEKTEQLMKQTGARCDPLEFYAIINAMYSDYCKVAKKFGVDRPDFYAELAKAWLMDKDAEDGKAMLYYECIVKK